MTSEKIEGWKHDLATKLFLWTNDGSWVVCMFVATSKRNRIKLTPQATYEDAAAVWMETISDHYGLRGCY